MKSHVGNIHDHTNKAVANDLSGQQSSPDTTFDFVDNRPEAIAQRKLQAMADKSPQAKQAVQLQHAIAQSHSTAIYQRQANLGEEALLQDHSESIQTKENSAGLPDHLKTGIESLSGYSMDDVKVHYNSSKPAQLSALAYAQGNDIHLGTGQVKHLPHEAWHVVQQKQGRVKPTMQMAGQQFNNDTGLEKEADVMGRKVLQNKYGFNNSPLPVTQKPNRPTTSVNKSDKGINKGPIQAKMDTTEPFTECDVDLTSKTPNTFKSSGKQALSGSAAKTNVFLTALTETNNPPDLKDMDKWKEYLTDPNTNNTLTKMHQINGVFFGPVKTTNIFLGTAASNNTSDDSHLRQVEQPIENYMGEEGPRAVDYTVEPDFGTVPVYIQDRIDEINDVTERDGFEAWAKQATPAKYTCTAIFYRTKESEDAEMKEGEGEGEGEDAEMEESEESEDVMESLTQIENLNADL